MKKVVMIVFLSCFVFVLPAVAALPEGDLLDGAQPGPDGKIDVLTVFAHPDDESIYGGGALLKAGKDPRVRIHILCLCRGNWVEQAKMLGISVEQLVKIRARELKSAASVYGAEQVIHWMNRDGSLPSVDREKLIGDIAGVIIQVGAEIVITHDPGGMTGHPDHIVCSSATTEAFKRTPAVRLYYPTLSKFLYRIARRVTKQYTKAEAAAPTFKVNIEAVKELKRLACYAHASQLHFSDISAPAKLLLLFNYEYWTLAASK